MELESDTGDLEDGQVVVTDAEEVPEATKWKDVCVCCGKRVLLVMPSDRLFCEHWEISLCMPIFVHLIVIYCLIMYIFATLFYLPSSFHQFVSLIDVAVTLILFMWSYLGAMCMDPGFLPYTWATTRRYRYTWEEQLDGLAIRPDQIEYAQKHRPEFASFSTSAGRFVMRADHVCDWVANWIGKRNHKQFILMMVWGSLFSVSLFAWRFLRTVNLLDSRPALFWMDLIASLFELIFAMALPATLVGVMWDLLMNRTQLQRWRGVQGESLGCCDSCREVFGNGSVFAWIIPTPAFGEDPYE